MEGKMKFKIDHVNINVGDLDKSLEFYHKALALEEVKRHHAPDGSFIIVFLSDGETENGIELTWLREMKKPYDLGVIINKLVNTVSLLSTGLVFCLISIKLYRSLWPILPLK